MEFAEWEPVYEAILADFGYGRAGDEAARDRLADLVGDRGMSPANLDLGGTVAVVAPGPSLEAELDRLDDVDRVVAASSAADRLDDAGLVVDCQVTDLDGDPERAAARTRAGTPVAVHAHGDNRPALSTLEDCDRSRVVPTTQAAPAGPVHNLGGFTDGDRAAFLADALGADRLRFVGWDLDAADRPEKRHKLRWAARLLAWLERRRGERFDLLDGRREGVEPVSSH